MAKSTVAVKFTGDVADLKRAVGDADKRVGDFGNTVDSSGKKAGLGLAAVGVGAAAMVKGWVSAATESAKISKQTDAVIKSTGGAAQVTADQVGKLSEALARKSGVDDEVIQSGENVLLTFTKVRNEVGKGNDIFSQATTLALDMSVALGTDMSSASMLLGKALNDPIKGMTALTKSGVSFTEQQKEQVKAMVASGDVMGAQKLILKELGSEFEGSAAAQATAGEKLQVVFGNLQEKIGGALLPAFSTLAGGATFLLDKFDALPAPTQDLISKFIAFGAVGVGAAAGIAFVAGKVEYLKTNLGPLLPAMTNAEGGLNRLGKIAGTVGFVGLVAGSAALANSLNVTTVNVDAMSAALARNDVAQKQQIGSFLVVLDHWGKLDGAIRQAASSNVEGADRMIQAAQAAGLSGDKIAHLKDIVDQKRGADVQGAVDQKAYGDATADAAAKAGDLSTQLEKLANDLRAQFDPLFAAQNASQNLAKAQADAAAAARDHGAGSREAAAANMAAVQAALSYEGSLIALKAAVEKGTVSLDVAKETMRGWVQQGLITKGQADQVAAGFVNVKGKADAIPKKVLVTVDANVDPATGKFNTFIRGVNSYGGALGHSQTAVSGKRAGGGPVDLGNAYLVGEEGPELFVPGASGTIIPNGGGSAAFLSTLATGFTAAGRAKDEPDDSGATAEEQRALDIRRQRGIMSVTDLASQARSGAGGLNAQALQFNALLAEFDRIQRDGPAGVAEGIRSAFGIDASGLAGAVAQGVTAAMSGIAPSQDQMTEYLRLILVALSTPRPLAVQMDMSRAFIANEQALASFTGQIRQQIEASFQRAGVAFPV